MTVYEVWKENDYRGTFTTEAAAIHYIKSRGIARWFFYVKRIIS
jgi:hypothetical protein